MIRLFLLVLLLARLWDGGPQQGRRGNQLYAQGRFQEAADAYRAGLAGAGLAGAGRAPGRLEHGLQNNLGAALYRQGDFAGAGEAFEAAAAAAPTPEALATAAYNAGAAAYARGDASAALQFFRQALLARPDFPDARYNYEVAARKVRQTPPPPPQRQAGGGSGEGEPQPQPGAQPADAPASAEPEGGDPDGSGEAPAEPETDAQRLTRAQAEQYLQALQDDEQKLLKEARRMKSTGRTPEKDW